MSNITIQDELKKNVSLMMPEFQKSLPAHIKSDKFVRAVQNAIVNNPSLASCERNSFFAACMKSAELGLMPNGKEAAIVPYKNKQGQHIATYIPMYEGLLKLVRNSGEIKAIVTELVYENDKFDYWIDETGPHLQHRPSYKKRGNFELVYCIVTTKDGAAYIEIMTPEELEKVEKQSRAQNGPWKDWRDEMIKKSVFRRLFKRLPKSSDLDQDLLERSLAADEEMDFRDVGGSDEPKAKAEPQSRLKGLLGVKGNKKVEPENKQVNDKPKEEAKTEVIPPEAKQQPEPPSEVFDAQFEESIPNFAPGNGDNIPI